MIQRIQSVYLILAAISALLLFFFPVAWFYGNMHTIEFYVYQVKDHIPDSTPFVESAFTLPLILLTAIIGALALLAIWMYKDLRRQLQFVRMGMFFTLAQIAALFFFYSDYIAKRVGAEADYEFGIFLPVIALLFFFLATRGIQKDIKLIRSADRLR